ncbi:TetR/AcrR family transcriptional regulator [Sediminivirga luteola]|nr:TetR family transcriptional regulator [Sediminivirga luteola]
MSSRRHEILDAAVRVLGAEGPRGLTHRAIDREAGLPLGSTANLFGRRTELLQGIVARMEELDRAQWSHDPGPVQDLEALAHALERMIRAIAEPPLNRVQKARYYLQMELPEETAETNRRLGAELQQMVRALGGTAEDTGVVLAALDGLMLRGVTYGPGALPAEGEMATALLRLMRGD